MWGLFYESRRKTILNLFVLGYDNNYYYLSVLLHAKQGNLHAA